MRTGDRFETPISFEQISQVVRDQQRLVSAGKPASERFRVHLFQAKAAGNANNDWKLSHRLIVANWDRAAHNGQDPPLYEEVKDVFEELYQGGLWKTENFIPDPSVLSSLASNGIRMVRANKTPICR